MLETWTLNIKQITAVITVLKYKRKRYYKSKISNMLLIGSFQAPGVFGKIYTRIDLKKLLDFASNMVRASNQDSNNN